MKPGPGELSQTLPPLPHYSSSPVVGQSPVPIPGPPPNLRLVVGWPTKRFNELELEERLLQKQSQDYMRSVLDWQISEKKRREAEARQRQAEEEQAEQARLLAEREAILESYQLETLARKRHLFGGLINMDAGSQLKNRREHPPEVFGRELVRTPPRRQAGSDEQFSRASSSIKSRGKRRTRNLKLASAQPSAEEKCLEVFPSAES